MTGAFKSALGNGGKGGFLGTFVGQSGCVGGGGGGENNEF